MKAEIRYKHLDYLNEVRQRARGGEKDILQTITTTDPDQLRDIIYEERTRELVGLLKVYAIGI